MNTQTQNLPNEREYGIDLLRIVAAFYVIVLHTVRQGGILEAATTDTYQFYVCQAMISLAYCAVNLYGLISGYVGYSDTEKPFQPAKLLLLWLEVVFYGVGITLLSSVFFPAASASEYWSFAYLPLSKNTYWYFTAYCALFFFIPLLNSCVRHSSSNNLRFFFLSMIFFFSPFESSHGTFYTNCGYSFLWLMILYLCGAIMKKAQLCRRIHPALAVFGILLCTAGNYYLRISSKALFNLEHYSFPLYLISAMCHLALFSRMRIGKLPAKLIRLTAPAAFAVYISNVQPFVWNDLMHDRFQEWALSSPLGLAIRVVLFSALYVAVIACIDFLRRKLFQLLHLRQALDALFALLNRKISILHDFLSAKFRSLA